MKKAIVTGANGFVGAAVVKELLQHNYQVFALVRNRSSLTIEHENVSCVFWDGKDVDSIQDLLPPQAYQLFYHFAWAGSSNPADRVNVPLQLECVNMAVNMVSLAKALHCDKFICSGSIMEQEVEAIFTVPNTKPSLAYIYGGAKSAAHIMCQAKGAELGIEVIWAQITNAYGVGERSQRMLTSTIQKCIDGVSPQFTAGTQNYDFIYIDDVAAAFRLLGEKGQGYTTYVIGSGSAKPLKEFLLEMKEQIAPELDFVFGDVPFTGVNLSLDCFDIAALVRDTGFRPSVSFGEGTYRTMEWMWGEVN